MRNATRAALVLGAAVLLSPAATFGDEGRTLSSAPAVACSVSATRPPYSDPPTVQVWSPRSPNQAAGTDIPVCGGIGPGGARELISLAGRIRHHGDAASLMARFGALSRFTGLRFWAVSEQRWAVLIDDSYAIDAPSSDRPRRDFTPEEMQPGRDLFFAQGDPRTSGPTVYHLQVLERSRDHFVLSVENTTSIRMLLFPLFGEGDLRILYRLERLAGDEWGYYSVLQIGEGASALVQRRDAAYINRLTAVFRHIAGIPDTQEPPAAPS